MQEGACLWGWLGGEWCGMAAKSGAWQHARKWKEGKLKRLVGVYILKGLGMPCWGI